METMHSRRVPMSLNRPGPRYQPENQFQSSVPGPVEYGDATTRMDEYSASLRHPGRRGLLDAVRDEVHSAFPPPKPGPSPSQYQKVQVRPVKPASKIGANGLHDLSREPRGPCNFTTGPRFPSSADRIGLAPGQYGIPEANLSTTHRVPVIEFSETARFPKKPTDYYGLHHLAHLPRPAEDPGPGHYTAPLVEPRPATHHGPSVTPFNDLPACLTCVHRALPCVQKDVTGPGMRAGTGALPMTGKQSTANLSSTLPRFQTAGQNDEYMLERLRCGSRVCARTRT
ncbi:uncharacterized protein MONBRDRAFT_11238 [Monosiga brevicollis MX1]|uniref:Uncharacterized protein n=1 Tax=Monosiga brevicollis TaxID=81824 RepID=A9V8M0_MONBE|nr:uncharacterized protein MONBRDRAFT_11238 [Monosiga brevicollis MX1]EDQ86167.1 predicted protein [Monosiga brevicollis MX1]|eukprot:XP_001749092.1 hypothetical protein [Monosiga brevicollis MX1]